MKINQLGWSSTERLWRQGPSRRSERPRVG